MATFPSRNTGGIRQPSPQGYEYIRKQPEVPWDKVVRGQQIENAISQQNQSWGQGQTQVGQMQATPEYNSQTGGAAFQGMIDQTQGMTTEERNDCFNNLKSQLGGRLARFERRMAGGNALDPAQTARYNNFRQSMNSLSQVANNPMAYAQATGKAGSGIDSGDLMQSTTAIQTYEQLGRPDLAARYADTMRQKIQEEMKVFEDQQSQGLPMNQDAMTRYDQLKKMMAGVVQYIQRMAGGTALRPNPILRPNPEVRSSPWNPKSPHTPTTPKPWLQT